MRTRWVVFIAADVVLLGALTWLLLLRRPDGTEGLSTTASVEPVPRSPASPPAASAGAPIHADAADPCDEQGWCIVSHPPSTDTLHGIWGSGPNDVWAVGSSGGDKNQPADHRPAIWHWDGRAWDLTVGLRDFEAGTPKLELEAAWGVRADDVWAVGTDWIPSHYGAAILHWNGTSWSRGAGLADRLRVMLNAASARAPEEAWAVGLSGVVLRWDGTSWSRPACKLDDKAYLSAVWSSGPDDTWVGGTMGIAHWNGKECSLSVRGPSVSGLWGSGPSDVWAVGERGTILHWDGAAWSGRMFGVPLHGVWGSGPHDVWAVGQNGTVLHWNGRAWSVTRTSSDVYPLQPHAHLLAVWGSGPLDVWAAGERGTLLHRRSAASEDGLEGPAWEAPEPDDAQRAATTSAAQKRRSDGGRACPVEIERTVLRAEEVADWPSAYFVMTKDPKGGPDTSGLLPTPPEPGPWLVPLGSASFSAAYYLAYRTASGKLAVFPERMGERWWMMGRCVNGGVPEVTTQGDFAYVEVHHADIVDEQSCPDDDPSPAACGHFCVHTSDSRTMHVVDRRRGARLFSATWAGRDFADREATYDVTVKPLPGGRLRIEGADCDETVGPDVGEGGAPPYPLADPPADP